MYSQTTVGQGGFVLGWGADVGMRVHLFGPVRVQVDGKDVDVRTWKSKKAVTLLKYLVARCGSRVPRDVLIDLLWPDSFDGERSVHNLHTVVYYLRRELEPSLGRYEQPRFLRHTHGLYWINTDAPVWSDIQEFRRAVREGERLHQCDEERALEHYRRALVLYADDFCPEDYYEDWAVTVREKFRDMYILAALQTAELLVRVERGFGEAVAICRAALAREPYREELHQAIMTHLMNAGRYGEAAQQFRTCAKMLDEEFGLQPSPDTVAVYETMRRHAGAPPGESVREASSRTSIPSVTTEAAAVTEVDDSSGPLVCDMQTYNALYRLELQRHARLGKPVTVLSLALGDGVGANSPERHVCADVMSKALRGGDVLCWEGAAKAAILLARTGYDGAAAVENRLRHSLERAGLVFFELECSVIEPDGEGADRRRARDSTGRAAGTVIEAAG